ncbi:amino acid ABC transporter ATP-binding/permease protein [Donghicola tyrosinivorans]|uniref:ATP-binding cassette subfamily C protein CydC n=1 Tax=Donghicola tyrosinivorans TaxID=1652492 RepID=A0A2T0WJF5_9RHOB|nr:ATP-binding cassette domain-containing protein [Donghicola tyrosinivorans]PRY86838.1 ATP-binding cassette subfamily C protein CydC [Donghicola tyrosinivorans]
MRAMWFILRRTVASAPKSIIAGALLTVAVLLMGVALLGVSGWFITAAGIAGLAGSGVLFDVFRPSAGVRFLAIGRTAARYGERVVTHEATLRALAALRVDLLAGLMTRPLRGIERLRAGSALNRMVADVDALDGVLLRLALPLGAGVLTQLAALWVLVWLTSWPVALAVVAPQIAAVVVVVAMFGRAGLKPATRAERALQAVRKRAYDLFAARADLTVYGAMGRQRDHVMSAARRLDDAQDKQDRIERGTRLLTSLGVQTSLALSVYVGFTAVAERALSAPLAMMAVLVALALGESLMPLARAVSELGRMADAARRVQRDVMAVAPDPGAAQADLSAPMIEVRDWRLRGDDAPISFTVGAGETVILSAASGGGKTTLLGQLAGLAAPTHGAVRIYGAAPDKMPEAVLRDMLGYVPQRTVLLSGTFAETLTLAGGEMDNAAMQSLYGSVDLSQLLVARGGLDAPVGVAGDTLSGGQRRRVAIARAISCKPMILLMDEPTEGMDQATAKAVLEGVRKALPEAAIVIASHRQSDRRFADRVIPLR